MMNELPEGWSEGRIRSLFDCWGGMTPSTSVSAYWGGSMPWISSKDVKTWRLGEGTEFVTKKALEETRLRACRPGCVLLVVRSGVLAHTLPVAVTTRGVVVNQDIKALDSGDRQLNEWLALYLHAHENDILERNRKDGTTVQSIRVNEVLDLNLPVPPLAEQNRIVTKVEALLAEVNSARDRLAQVPTILKRFRQSVLAAGYSGRLTEEWRSVSDADTRTGAVVLDGIRRKRRALGESREGRRGRYAEPPGPSGTPHDELPESWVWTTFDQLAFLITKGSSPGWQGFEYVKTGLLFVRSQNVRWGDLDLSDRIHVDRSFNESHQNSVIREGDVLLNLVGASVGRAAVATREVDGANCNQAVGIIRLVPGGALERWILLYLLSPEAQAHINTNKVDVARANFNLDDIKVMPVPLPPISEQREITRRIDILFKTADAIEEHLMDASGRADKVAEAVLVKAVRGELVSSEAELALLEDRDYEPASALLERIRGHSAGQG